jgi:hypothetical protein
VSSRFGPTDSTLPIPQCDTAPLLGGSVTLAGDGNAVIDGQTVEHVTLAGERHGMTDETWTASRTGQLGNDNASYRLAGEVGKQQIQVSDTHGSRVMPVAGFTAAFGVTVDAPVAFLVSSEGVARIAEDRGTELIEEARSRHCRINLDGPQALSVSVLVRLMVDGSIAPSPRLENWRGSLDWWVFADGQLGQAIVTIGGYPGDAWQRGGLQATITARMTATDRSGSAFGVRTVGGLRDPSPTWTPGPYSHPQP